jgi:hypothetical protein
MAECHLPRSGRFLKKSKQMSTAEKIASAKSNRYFTLFKEGMFYKCYNEDAMVFVTRVKQYKVSGTYVKNV